MKDGIPAIYWMFRWAWSVLHLVVLVLLAGILIVWATTDDHGAHALSGWMSWIQGVRSTLSNLIPYPWS